MPCLPQGADNSFPCITVVSLVVREQVQDTFGSRISRLSRKEFQNPCKRSDPLSIQPHVLAVSEPRAASLQFSTLRFPRSPPHSKHRKSVVPERFLGQVSPCSVLQLMRSRALLPSSNHTEVKVKGPWRSFASISSLPFKKP